MKQTRLLSEFNLRPNSPNFTLFSFYLGLTDDRAGANMLANDHKPFTTLGYTNGPGAYAGVNATTRPNITNTNTG